MADKTKKPETKPEAQECKEPLTLDGPSGKVVTRLQSEGRRVQVLGRVRNGVIELDQNALEEMARRYPNANMTFVAVNAPFDPSHQYS